MRIEGTEFTGDVEVLRVEDSDGNAVSVSSAGGKAKITLPASGGSQPFVPTDLDDLALWLDASTLDLADDDPVALWPDSSPNGYDAAQATADNQPVFKAAARNGLGVVRFDSSVTPRFLALSGAGLSLLNGASGVTLAAAFVNREDAGFGEQDFLCASVGGDATKRRLQVSFDTGSHIIEAFASNDDAADENYATAQPLVGMTDQTGDSSQVGPTGAMTLTVAIDPTGPRSAIGLTEGGGFGFEVSANAAIQPGYTPGPFPSTNSAAVLIGGDNGASGSYPLQDADLCELIVYRRALSAGERRQVAEYLSAKWATL